MAFSSAGKWLIVTTDNLPEAYYMARHLMSKSQQFAILNIKGRSFQRTLKVLKRLARKRGVIYLIDFCLGRILKKYYQDPNVLLFPDINSSLIENIRANNIYYDSENPHNQNTLDIVRKYNPDYILLLGAPVIKPSLFELAKKGTINWHHGYSPIYRGSDCVHWAMARNDFENIGYTIHFVSKVVDGGKILLQRKISFRNNLTFSEALAYTANKGMEGFVEVINNIISDKDIAAKEQGKGGDHYPPAGWRIIRRAYTNYRKFTERPIQDVVS
jgi:folate-dependent phosphoribosylglycinamide formyltransferase PurN